MSKLLILREEFPTFSYDRYDWRIEADGLHIDFYYTLNTQYSFIHSLVIKEISQNEIDATSGEQLKSMIFSLGMAEMLSYWKTTCSPTIIVRAGFLSNEQIEWWHHLLLHGMGEFFYVNNIDFSIPGFVTIINDESIAEPNTKKHQQMNSSISQLSQSKADQPLAEEVTSVLIPIGGGKDSIVTIELLKQLPDLRRYALLINPTQASKDTLIQSNISKSIFVDRNLDPVLYTMNKSEFLNGHVPISSVIAFLSVLVSTLKNIDCIAISNERSSNEGNITFHGQEINHQYSKTFEFEKRFQEYCKTHLNNQQSINVPYYFSYMRPLYELQIAGLFAEMSEYHYLFRSCNRGQKTNEWCGNCPKCLFAYLILYPFMDHDYIVSLFGRDVFANENLKETALELINLGKNKPLECVGVYEESLVAFYMSIKKLADQHIDLPVVLQLVKEQAFQHVIHIGDRTTAIFNSWNNEHGIPQSLLGPITKATQRLKELYG